MRLKCFCDLLHVYNGPSKKVTEFAIWMNRGRFTWIKIFEKRGEGHSRINASGNRYLRNRPAQRREVTQRVELGSSIAVEAGTSYLRVERMSVSMKPSVQAIRSQLPLTKGLATGLFHTGRHGFIELQRLAG